jgi:hypothetical protein
VTSNLEVAIEEWKTADGRAHEAERCLYEAWDAYVRRGIQVPADLQQQATTARAEAVRKLRAALAVTKAGSGRPQG